MISSGSVLTSSFSISRLIKPILKLRNARSMRAFVSWSFVKVLFAKYSPLSKPASPPKKMPPVENRVNAATSPKGVGLIAFAISGVDSISCQFKVTKSRYRARTPSSIGKSNMSGFAAGLERSENFPARTSKSVRYDRTDSQTSKGSDG